MRVEHKEGSREVYFDSFPPGSVIAFKISLFPHVKEAVDSVRYSTFNVYIAVYRPNFRRISFVKLKCL